MVRFSNGLALTMAIAIVPTIWKPDHLKHRLFCPDFKWFWPNGCQLFVFQMVGLLDFRSHLKLTPFATQLILDHSNSIQFQISDPPCSGNIWIVNFYLFVSQMVGYSDARYHGTGHLNNKQVKVQYSNLHLEVEHPICILLKAGQFCLGGSNPAWGEFIN